MAEITYQMVLSTLQTAGILVGIFYYVMTLRNQHKSQEISTKNQELTLETRQAQLFMHIYRDWYNSDFWEHWDNVMQYDFETYDEFYGNITPEVSRSSRSLFAFFEGLGVLVNRGLIEPSFIDDLMSAMVVSFWERMKPVYTEYRIRRNAPMVAEWIEYLYNTIKPIMDAQHPEMIDKQIIINWDDTDNP